MEGWRWQGGRDAEFPLRETLEVRGFQKTEFLKIMSFWRKGENGPFHPKALSYLKTACSVEHCTGTNGTVPTFKYCMQYSQYCMQYLKHCFG